MIYTGLNKTGEVQVIHTHGGGTVGAVYGGINEANPIYYKTRTLTGTLPLSYKALRKPLSDYLLSGNTTQNGTPTPDAPVDVVGCGERTENLFDVSVFVSVCRKSDCTAAAQGTGITITPSGDDSFIGSSYIDGQIIGQTDRLALIPVQENMTYTLLLSQAPKAYITYVDSGYAAINDNYISITQTYSPIAYVFTTPTGCSFVLFRLGRNGTSVYTYDNIMLVKGQKALSDFEPFGYKLPLTVNGTEYPIYLGQVPTTRRIKKLVLTGEEPGWTVIRSDNQAFLSLPATAVSRTVFSTHYKGLVQAVTGNAWINSSLDKLIIMDTVHATDATTFKQYLAAQYSAGTPVTVWYALAEPETGIVNEPLHKIGDYADTSSMAQAGVTIPTVAGANTLTVDTTVQPSEVSITGNIKEVST